MNKYKMRMKKGFKNFNHFRALNIRFLSPTNYKGSRIKINDLRNKKSKIISWDYSISEIQIIAIEYLQSIGIKINGFFYDSKKQEYILLTNDFKTELK